MDKKSDVSCCYSFLFTNFLTNSEWINILAFGVLLTVLILKILLEESFLKLRFGEEYLLYKSKTKRLIPYLI